MSLFSLEAYSQAEDLTKTIGLWDLFPGATLDAKIFDPCGYSLNAIVEVRTLLVGTGYLSWLIHLEHVHHRGGIACCFALVTLLYPKRNLCQRRYILILLARAISDCRCQLSSFMSNSEGLNHPPRSPLNLILVFISCRSCLNVVWKVFS